MMQTPANLEQMFAFVAQYVAMELTLKKVPLQFNHTYMSMLSYVGTKFICYLGELNRMTQFKDKSKNQK